MDFDGLRTLFFNICRRYPYNRMELIKAILLLVCRHAKEGNNPIDWKFDPENWLGNISHITDDIEKHMEELKADLFISNWHETIYMFATSSLSKHKDFSPTVSFIDESLSDLMLYFLQPNQKQHIYVPFGGDYHCFVNHQSATFHIETSTEYDYVVNKMLAVANNLSNVVVTMEDSFLRVKEDDHAYSKIYVPLMPFSSPQRGLKSQSYYILDLINNLLAEKGRLAVLLPESFTFGSRFFELRKTLIERRQLRFVISLGVPYCFKGYSNVNMCVVLIEKSTKDDHFVWFYPESKAVVKNDPELSDQLKSWMPLISRVISNTPIQILKLKYEEMWHVHDLELHPFKKSYTLPQAPQGYRYVKLREIGKLLRNNHKVEETEFALCLQGKDIAMQDNSHVMTLEDISLKNIHPGRHTLLAKKAFCFNPSSCRYAIVDVDKDVPTYISPGLFCFILTDSRISYEYLYVALNDPNTHGYIVNLTEGAALSRLKPSDFLEVPILIPDENRDALFQQSMMRTITEWNERSSRDFASKTAREIESMRESIRDKVHLIAPYSLSIQGCMRALIRNLEQGKSLSANSQITANSDVTLLNYLKFVQNRVKKQGNVIASMGKASIYDKAIPLNLSKEVSTYIRDCSVSGYAGVDFETASDEDVPEVLFSQFALQYMLDTLIDNACRHGFTDFSGKKIVKVSIQKVEDANFVKLIVANTGHRVSNDFSDVVYSTKGLKAGPNANSGRGGKFVADTIHHYNGMMRIITDDKDWSFIVELFIPSADE